MYRQYIQGLIAAAACVALTANLWAQAPNSAYFTDDFKYRHDLNPAFGNAQSYVAVPALGSVNVKTMGNFGYQDVVRTNPLYPAQSSKKKTTFLNPYLSNPLDGFSSGWNKIGIQADIALLSAGFKAFGGYNTVELNSRTTANLKLPYELLKFAVNTGNKNYNIGDISAGGQSFAELAFGHSRDIDSHWRVGAKFKLLFGIADASLEMKNVKAHLTGNTWTISGDAQAHMSMKGFSYKSETKDYEQGGSYRRVNDVDIDGAGIGGFGAAIDLGGVYTLDENWQFSAALLDLGFISWSNDMYATNEEKTFTFNGFHDVGVHSGDSPLDDQADSYSDQIADFYNLRDRGDRGGRTTGIGARLNLGASYALPMYNKLKFGLLSSTRFLGTHTWTEARLSANCAPLSWVDGNVNLAVNSYTTSFGWMLNFHPKGFNVFVGMDHLVGKCSNEMIPLSSNASLTAGFNVAW